MTSLWWETGGPFRDLLGILLGISSTVLCSSAYISISSSSSLLVVDMYTCTRLIGLGLAFLSVIILSLTGLISLMVTLAVGFIKKPTPAYMVFPPEYYIFHPSVLIILVSVIPSISMFRCSASLTICSRLPYCVVVLTFHVAMLIFRLGGGFRLMAPRAPFQARHSWLGLWCRLGCLLDYLHWTCHVEYLELITKGAILRNRYY